MPGYWCAQRVETGTHQGQPWKAFARPRLNPLQQPSTWSHPRHDCLRLQIQGSRWMRVSSPARVATLPLTLRAVQGMRRSVLFDRRWGEHVGCSVICGAMDGAAQAPFDNPAGPVMWHVEVFCSVRGWCWWSHMGAAAVWLMGKRMRGDSEPPKSCETRRQDHDAAVLPCIAAT
jgi:hypothetical protein